MPVDRREFLAAASSIATVTALASPNPAHAQAPGPASADPLGVRGDFPIVEGRVYLNSAYIAPVPTPVAAAGTAFLQAKSVRPITVGEMLGRGREVREQFARLINVSTDEVGLLMATTEAENVLANTLPMQSGDNIVIDDLHYEGAEIVYQQARSRRGIELRIARHRDGVVTPNDIARLVDGRTRLVSVSLVSSINGYRHDARALADVAHAHGAHLHLDAIQGLGMFPFDARAAGVDSLCSGTYKWLLGGFGVAPFFVTRAVLDRTAHDRFGVFGGAGGQRYGYATLPFAEVFQLGAALTYLERVGVARIEAHTMELTRRVREGLVRQGYRLLQPMDNRSSIVAFGYTRSDADVQQAFAAARIDVTHRPGSIRASLSLFNNVADVDQLLAVTGRLA